MAGYHGNQGGGSGGGGGGAKNHCRVSHNLQQSISNNTPVTLNFNQEVFDVGDFHDPVTNNSRLVLPADGAYIIGWSLQMNTVSGSSFDQFDVILLRNGASETFKWSGEKALIGNNNPGLWGSIIENNVAGTYYELQILHNRTNSVGILQNSDTLSFWIKEV